VCGLALGQLNDSLLNGFQRLLQLLDAPEDIETLAPLIEREILYRLLRGEHGPMLQQVWADHGGTVKISEAVLWIREHFREPFSVKMLASRLHMSEASLNRHFRAVTAMSPLQYQKQVRLQEARRLLMSEDADAATTASRVRVAFTVQQRVCADLRESTDDRCCSTSQSAESGGFLDRVRVIRHVSKIIFFAAPRMRSWFARTIRLGGLSGTAITASARYRDLSTAAADAPPPVEMTWFWVRERG
jgi:AraC-like DNA-binding protein